MLNLDTHILLLALTGELRPKERRIVEGQPWTISAIVLWEIAKLAQLGRIEADLHDAELIRVLTGLHTWPLSLEVCRTIADLDFEGDPADGIIAATSVVHRVPLVTRDRRIRGSRIVPLAR